jgi:hypothetical protein
MDHFLYNNRGLQDVSPTNSKPAGVPACAPEREPCLICSVADCAVRHTDEPAFTSCMKAFQFSMAYSLKVEKEKGDQE